MFIAELIPEFMKIKKSEYAEKHSLVQEFSQEDALGFHQQQDEELMRHIQDELVAESGELISSAKLYPQNPCEYGFVLSGIRFKGVYIYVILYRSITVREVGLGEGV